MSGAEIDALPDPELFRDAMTLAEMGRFSARDLDEMDASLLALIRQFKSVTVRKS